MLKKMAKTASLALALATVPGNAFAAMGPDAAACRAGAAGPAVLVSVDGFQQRSGNVRVNVYGSDRASIRGQIWNGRGGVMPTWGGRFSPETIKALAVYIHANAAGQ